MNNDEIIQFHIDIFKPDTLPMSRFAQYMTALAALYGNDELVHFDKVLKGSAVLQVKLAEEIAPEVLHRLHSVHNADVPPDIEKAYSQINNLLRNDRAIGKIKRPKGAVILSFPGRKTVAQDTYRVREVGVLDGVVIRIGGKDSTIPVWLQDQSGKILYCEANQSIARELVNQYLGAQLRVTGQGEWLRNEDGKWELQKFKINEWSILDDEPIEDILNAARCAKGNHWNEIDDPIKAHLNIRGSD